MTISGVPVVPEINFCVFAVQAEREARDKAKAYDPNKDPKIEVRLGDEVR